MQQALQNDPNDCGCIEIHELADELKAMLVQHSTILTEEGVRRHIEKMQQCDFCRKDSMSQESMDWLVDLRNRLRLAADEMQRLEGEGGAPASKDQGKAIEELLKTVGRLDLIIENYAVSDQPKNSH